ncbi:MAG: phage head-tail connector protein [Holophagaceae bacterium]|nr:phage head-tail connector protein [Holophagaceae bacterium]
MSRWKPKIPDSQEFFTIDLARQLTPGDRVVSCECEITLLHGDDPNAGDMLLGPVEINGSCLAQKVGGGIIGCRYQLNFNASTLYGELLKPYGDFHVGTKGAGNRDLVSLDAVKSWLGIADENSDVLLQRLITAESQAIEKAIGRPILATERTDFIAGYGSSTIMPPATPILEVERAFIDGAEVKTRHDNLTIWRADGGPWPKKSRIQITYTAGYLAVPYDIEQACIELVALHYKERDRIGHQSKSIAGETVSFITAAMPASVEASIKRYRKVAPF